MSARKIQRIRDPIHGLISFSEDVELLVWRLLNAREMQRLRRIHQLGFSSLVFPNATHSRFSHSVGVFHNARRLLDIIEKKFQGTYDKEREVVTLCAALLHDVGHGPFSHTFEDVQKRLGVARDHEEWTAAIVEGDTEVNGILTDYDANLATQIAALVRASEPPDIYATVVSSQFDADRLDYLVRDRYMTGVHVGAFDLDWLLDCLEIDDIYVGAAGESEDIKAPGLVLNSKGFGAAEGYLEARYQLYSSVYLHKTTRSAEKMLGALLVALGETLRSSGPEAVGLPPQDPLVDFLTSDAPDLSTYLRIDDYAVWAVVSQLEASTDEFLADLAKRLLHRRLYKCVDIGARFKEGSDIKFRFREQLRVVADENGLKPGRTLLEDEPRVRGYDWYNWNDESALKKVLVQDAERTTNIDIGEKSDIIKALKKKEFYRVYVPGDKEKEKIESAWRGMHQ